MQKKELLDKIKKLNKDIVSHKIELSKLKKQKEEWFSKKEEIKQKIKQLITGLREIKAEKSLFYEKINKIKKQRNEYNKKVKNLIKEIRRLKAQQLYELKKGTIINPSKLQKIIEVLQTKIETEAISFKKEQEIMEKIKKIKKDIKDNTKHIELLKKQNEISKEIKETRSKADEFHNQILEILKQEEGYKSFVSSYKEITQLRAQQEEAFDNFIKAKHLFTELIIGLRKKINEVKSYAVELDQKILSEKARNKEEKESFLNKKRTEIENKLKKGEKITTEDLISIQGHK